MVLMFWLAMCVVVGYFASNKGRNGFIWFVISLIFSPLLAGVILACLKDLTVDQDLHKIRYEHENLKDRVVLNEKITEHRLNNVESNLTQINNSTTNQKPIDNRRLLEDENKLCPACSESIKSSAIKCKHCGVMINDFKPTTCIFCGELINVSDKICRHCNSSQYLSDTVTDINNATNGSLKNKYELLSAEEKKAIFNKAIKHGFKPSDEVKKCINCGSILKLLDKECAKCKLIYDKSRFESEVLSRVDHYLSSVETNATESIFT